MPEDFRFKDEELEVTGAELKHKIDKVFGRSLAIRELDTGSDNSVEIELNNLSTAYYDVERFGVTFVASPRHADVLIVTGAITRNMEGAAKKTWEATPSPKYVVAVGDDACGNGILNDSYAVLGGADKVFSVDFRIPGNPPSPKQIIKGLLAFMQKIERQTENKKSLDNAKHQKIGNLTLQDQK
ncbi:MAG: NADH-quinone oxidoreductase subunit B family protein [Candidatus Bathyarchaeota archaeon]|nr:NADH-quinone oxidoreductase subunit B family protein [Candidatus Bathyarchaeota archaeon]